MRLTSYSSHCATVYIGRLEGVFNVYGDRNPCVRLSLVGNILFAPDYFCDHTSLGAALELWVRKRIAPHNNFADVKKGN